VKNLSQIEKSLKNKNYEISTLTANELSSHLDLMNLSILSVVIQKIVRGFQIQLNIFLQFQINFLKKDKKTEFFKDQPSIVGSDNIFPEAEILSLGTNFSTYLY